MRDYASRDWSGAFHEALAVINATVDGLPDRTKMGEIICRHGLYAGWPKNRARLVDTDSPNARVAIRNGARKKGKLLFSPYLSPSRLEVAVGAAHQ
jgi:hypothetical protein